MNWRGCTPSSRSIEGVERLHFRDDPRMWNKSSSFISFQLYLDIARQNILTKEKSQVQAVVLGVMDLQRLRVSSISWRFWKARTLDTSEKQENKWRNPLWMGQTIRTYKTGRSHSVKVPSFELGFSNKRILLEALSLRIGHRSRTQQGNLFAIGKLGMANPIPGLEILK